MTPNPIAPGNNLNVVGTGCAAGSPISFYVWQTAGGGHGYWHSADTPAGAGTGWTVDGGGAFNKLLAFGPAFTPDPGSELGVAASCTATYDATQASSPVADGSFLLVTLASPTVTVTAPTTVGYGAPVTVLVTPTRAAGTVTLKLDGATANVSGSAWGAYTVTLPGTTALGAHNLEAVFDPTVAGAPTVTGTATFTVTKAAATVDLEAAKRKIKKGKKAALTVRLTSTGPVTGQIQIKDGAKVRRTVTLAAGDGGVRRVKVKLPKLGKRKLTAVFAGNGFVTPATSGKVKVKVVR